MELFKKDIDSIIGHVSNDIVKKEKLTIDEFTKNINVSYEHYHQRLDTQMTNSSEKTQREPNFLNYLSLKLTSKINNLVKANNMEIVKNLNRLNNDVSQKFDKLLAYTNESIGQLCTNYKLQERDKFYKNINEVKTKYTSYL